MQNKTDSLTGKVTYNERRKKTAMNLKKYKYRKALRGQT